MERDLLNLDMDTALELVTTTEVPREFKDMAMEVITRDLLNLDTTMVMDILMFTRTVTTIMGPMDMKSSMIIRRDLLLLNQDMVVRVMSTEPLRDLLKAIMARGLLNQVMDTAQELATTTEVPREFKDMAMEVITRDLLILDTTMVMDNLMFTRTVITTMDLMDMRLNMNTRRDLLLLNPDMEVRVMSTELLRD